MKTKAMTSILALAVVTVTVALAQERFDMLVRQDFFAGFNGNREALERGMKITEDTLAKDPNHAEARVWHGSGILYLAGTPSRDRAGTAIARTPFDALSRLRDGYRCIYSHQQ